MQCFLRHTYTIKPFSLVEEIQKLFRSVLFEIQKFRLGGWTGNFINFL